MSCRLRAENGRLEVVGGELPVDLLTACRELAAGEPECRGGIVIRDVRGEAPRVNFQGGFSVSFQRRLRSLWGSSAEGGGLPEPLESPRPVFQVAIQEGGVRAILGAPPEVVARFCQAFARANPGARATVTGLPDDRGVRLQVQGDMPPPIQERLRRRWREHAAGPDPGALRKRGRRWPLVTGAVLVGVFLLGVLGERWG